MIYGKSLDYLKLFWGSGKTRWNEAKRMVMMKVTGGPKQKRKKKKKVSACSDVKKKKKRYTGWIPCV